MLTIVLGQRAKLEIIRFVHFTHAALPMGRTIRNTAKRHFISRRIEPGHPSEADQRSVPALLFQPASRNQLHQVLLSLGIVSHPHR